MGIEWNRVCAGIVINARCCACCASLAMLQVSTCSSKKYSACVRQTALAATGARRPWRCGCVRSHTCAGHIIVATDDGALMLFSPSGAGGADAAPADDDE